MSINNQLWILERLIVGELMVNCYIVGCQETREVFVVDPGGEGERILDIIKKLDLRIKAVINTHGHGDHINANADLVEATGAPLMIGEKDAEMLTDSWRNLSAPFGLSFTSPPADKTLKEGDTLNIGNRTLTVIETPGHSEGSITLVGDGFALVGDLLFAGSIGRTDLPGGDLDLLLRMVREKIFPLGDECEVYPGHGPTTTVQEERAHNPFLQEGFIG